MRVLNCRLCVLHAPNDFSNLLKNKVTGGLILDSDSGWSKYGTSLRDSLNINNIADSGAELAKVFF